MTEKEIKNYLINLGAKDIKEYELINNYGFLFTYDEKRFDLRFWANCYGAALNVWSCDESGNVPNSKETKPFREMIERYANGKEIG